MPIGPGLFHAENFPATGSAAHSRPREAVAAGLDAITQAPSSGAVVVSQRAKDEAAYLAVLLITLAILGLLIWSTA